MNCLNHVARSFLYRIPGVIGNGTKNVRCNLNGMCFMEIKTSLIQHCLNTT